MSPAMQQLNAAQRLRSARNYFVLLAIAASLIPGMLVVLGPLPESWEPRNVLLAFVLLGACAGFFIHHRWAGRQPVPECPNCAATWEIVESGGDKNTHLLKPGGQCPHCGTPIVQ